MLTYLIDVTDDILAVSVLIGIYFAYLSAFYGKWGKKIAWIGLGVGVLATAIRSAITNSMRLKGAWRIGLYSREITLILVALAIVATIIFAIKAVKEKVGEKGMKIVNYIIPSIFAFTIAGSIFNCASDVMAMPFKIDMAEGFLSTYYLYRLGGYLLGIIIAVVTSVATNKIGEVMAIKGYQNVLRGMFFAIFLLFSIQSFFILASALVVRKFINSQGLFNASVASTNNAMWYTFVEYIIIAVGGIFLWVSSYLKKEPYETNAQRRKQKSIWNKSKKQTITIAICLVLSILCATWFVELNTVKIEEAPLEDPIILKNALGEDETIVVPLTMVSDGHLHRFGYKTPDGITTRFIVVLKQEGTNNYGVGLDACEVCGEAGYYENKGQVVCKKCGVIMNKTTIGMKGGCNPIIIEYDIDETQITVPVSEMIKNQKNFK